MLYTHMQIIRDIFNTITTRGHSSLEKHTSHFIERVVCERYLETEQRLQHIETPNTFGYHSLSFPFSWAAQPGAWGPSLCWDMFLIPASSTPTALNFLSPGLYNNLTLTYFLRASQFVLNSRSPLISWYLRPDAPVIYTGAFLLLTAWPGSICNTLWFWLIVTVRVQSISQIDKFKNHLYYHSGPEW